MIITERNAYEAVVVLAGKKIRIGEFLNNLVKASVERKTRNIVLNVVSALPRPKYLEVLRDLIQSNISYALTIKYAGSSIQDLRKLINERNLRDVYVDNPSSDVVRILNSFNINPINIGLKEVRPDDR